MRALRLLLSEHSSFLSSITLCSSAINILKKTPVAVPSGLVVFAVYIFYSFLCKITKIHFGMLLLNLASIASPLPRHIRSSSKKKKLNAIYSFHALIMGYQCSEMADAMHEVAKSKRRMYSALLYSYAFLQFLAFGVNLFSLIATALLLNENLSKADKMFSSREAQCVSPASVFVETSLNWERELCGSGINCVSCRKKLCELSEKVWIA